MKVWWIMGCLVALTIFLVPASAQNLQEAIPVHSKAYVYLDDVLLESGKVMTSTVRPYTKAQFLVALALVDRSKLSEQGVASLNRLLDILTPKPIYKESDLFTFSTGVSIGLETYLHTDSHHTDLYKDFTHRLPIIGIPLALDFGDYLSADVDFDVRKEYFATYIDKPYFQNFNIPGDYAWLDLNLPAYTNLSFGNDHWNLSFGRNQVTIGPGEFSKLLISDNSNYLEYAALKTYWNALNFSAFYFSMDPALIGNESDTTAHPAMVGQAPIKSFFLHRTELALFDQRVNFAVSEGYMIGGAAPTLYDFNPLMVLHDFYEWQHASSILTVDLMVNPWKYFNIYGQFIMNRIRAPYEVEVYGDGGIPGATGYMAGGKFRMPLGPGHIGVVGEFWYTDPWLYIRETPLTSYMVRHTVVSNMLGTGAPVVASLPLGFKYGPDTMAFDLLVSYDWTDVLHAELDTSFVMQGEHTINTPYATGLSAVNLVTPTGVSENTLAFVLSAAFTPVDWLEINGSLGFYFISNQGHVLGVQSFDLQGSVGVQFVLGRKSYQNR